MIATNPGQSQGDDARQGASTSAPSRGSRIRPLALGIALGLILALVAMLLFFTVVRRGRPQLTQETYDAAVERWDKNGPADYDVDLELSGNRPGKIHVEVRGGEVVHMVRDGVEPSQRRTWDYWSVPGMLETIGQELEMARDPAASFNLRGATQMVMWAEFDPELGYPKSYDRVVIGADFEVHWKVARFAEMPGKN